MNRLSLNKLARKTPGLRIFVAKYENWRALQWDIYSLVYLSAFPVPFFPLTSSAIRPSSIRILLNEITIHNRKSFIEFGAGLSTLYLAEAARRNEGYLVTIEEDKAWLEIVSKYLREAGTADYVRLIHSPLVPLETQSNNAEWYDMKFLNSELGEESYDLSLVDAPVSRISQLLVRYPAGDFLKERMKPDFAIFLDDINRQSEQYIGEEWCKKHNWAKEDYWPYACLGVFRPKSSKVFNIL